MELDEALMILTEIATGDKEREAICLVKESVYGLQQEADAYRHMYEDSQKRLLRFRDLAAVPDIRQNTLDAIEQNINNPEKKEA